MQGKEEEMISGALSAMYTGIFLVDLVQDRYTQVKSDREIQQLLQSVSSAQKAIVYAIRNTVRPEQLDEMLAFVDLRTLPERMGTERSIDKDYKGVISGWVRGSFIEAERSPAGKLTKVLYTYQIIDEARRKEIERQKKAELQSRLAAVHGGRAEDSSGTWSIRLDTRGNVFACTCAPAFGRKPGFLPESSGPQALQTWLAHIHPADRERAVQAFRDTMRDGSENRVYDVECRAADTNGAYHWFRICGYPQRNVNGRLTVLSGFFVNMDDKYATYEVLYKLIGEVEESRNQALLENKIISSVSRLYFAIFRIDLLHDFYEEVSSDQSIHLLTGKTGKAQEKMNELCETLVSPEYRDMVRTFFDLSTVADRLSGIDTIELEYYAVDGNWHEARFIEKKRDENGRVTHILYVTRIVSRQKQKELEQERLRIACKIAEQANEAKTAFLFNMSHDIRTPMNAIIGYTQLLKNDYNKPEKVLHYQAKMQQASDFLLSLINNVLDMARIESGKMEVDNEYVNSNQVFDETIGVFEAAAKEKNITFEAEFDVETPHIMSDEVKIKQIYSNLISNAIKYTPAGGTVRVTVREYPGDSEDMIWIKSTFEDTGIGMSQEFLPHLFEAFEREHSEAGSKIIGTGLGMPIVKRLVELLGGSIAVESALGHGTKFTVMIPHRIADDEYVEAVERQAVAEVCSNALPGKRALLAEDNELNAEIAMTVLENMGMKVEHAADGIICVDMLEKSPAGYYDLILMDIQMPNMDGYKATTVIRRLPDQRKAAIPIIAMTANAFDEDRRNALQIGMDAHLAKPLQIEALKYTLGLVLTRNEINEDNERFWSSRLWGCDAIREFERTYRKRGIPCGWLIYEAYGGERIRYADKTLIRMFGCQDFQEFFNCVGGSFRTMVYREDIARVEDEIYEQINHSAECVDRVRYRVLRKDGAIRTIDDIGNKAFIENGIPVFYVCLVDVTDCDALDDTGEKDVEI